MRYPGWAVRSMLSASLLILAACGGGGGSAPVVTLPSGGGSSGQTASVSIGAPAAASLNGNAALTASGATPNFTTSLPPIGTVFPLNQSVVSLTPTNATAFTPNGGATVTFQGTKIVNGTSEGIFELKVPSLSLDVSNLTGDATQVTLQDGSKVALAEGGLNYARLSVWSVIPAASNGTISLGHAVSGYQTPAANVPAGGSAIYVGNGGSVPTSTLGGVVGTAFAPSGSSIGLGTLDGDANISVNFSTASLTGSLTNMTVTPANGGGAAAPWNNVTLSGTLSGATLSGNAAAASAPSGSFSLSNAATGTFNGALYGPNGQELGMVWTLHEATSDGGKSAIGIVLATKQ